MKGVCHICKKDIPKNTWWICIAPNHKIQKVEVGVVGVWEKICHFCKKQLPYRHATRNPEKYN